MARGSESPRRAPQQIRCQKIATLSSCPFWYISTQSLTLEYCEAHCDVRGEAQAAPAPTPEPPGPQGPRSIRAIIADLSRPLPKACIATKTLQGSRIDYIHWQTAVRLLDQYAPGWRGEVIRLDHVAGHCVIVYRITVPCAEGEVWREATGCEEEDLKGYGDMFSNAEAMAFKRAAAKFGLALELYDKKEGKGR